MNANYALAWIAMPIMMVFNAAIRELIYKEHMSELSAHQISTVTGIILLGLYVWFLTLRWKINSAGQALVVGFVWLILTVGFEFLFGHFIMRDPWSRLLHDYNILKGRIWILVPIWITITPLIFYKLQSN